MLRKTQFFNKNCHISKFEFLRFLLYLSQFLSYIDPFYHFGILKVSSITYFYLKNMLWTVWQKLKKSFVYFFCCQSLCFSHCNDLANYKIDHIERCMSYVKEPGLHVGHFFECFVVGHLDSWCAFHNKTEPIRPNKTKPR